VRLARQHPAAVGRLAATLALAAFCAFHWANLLTAPPVARVLLMLAILGLGGWALARVGARPPSPRRLATAGAVVLVTLAAALVAIGLPARELLPGNWDELGASVTDGMRAIGNVTYPYDEGEPAARLVLMLGLPILLGTATALAFWPAPRRGSLLRTLALLIFLGTYGVAAVLYDPGHPLLHGLILLVLVAGYLWAPQLRGWELGLAAAVVLTAGAVALPLARGLEPSSPLVDYRHWNWAGGEASVTFQWSHSYDRLNWPRKGTNLLEVASDSPHYWRAEVLEGFDGYRWTRSPLIGGRLELPSDVEGPASAPNPKWATSTEVTVRELKSSLVVTPGAVQGVEGVSESLADDGTAFAAELPESGQSYQVRAYAPDPSVEQMRRASGSYDPVLERFTSLELPVSRLGPDDTSELDAGDATDALATQPVQVPLRGEPLGQAREAIKASGYGGVLSLAERLTRDAPTPYDAVVAVRRHLQHGFAYSIRGTPGDRPLRSFLLGTHRGYCQQFSGAMALLLRMSGIPSRVAAGFTPGSTGRDGGNTYTVRDTDAHSWVEVYFTGIGWVPFDPTPVAAPATAQANPDVALATPSAGASPKAKSSPAEAGSAESRPSPGGSSAMGPVVLAVLAASLGATLLAIAIRRRRFRALTPEERLDAQAHELQAALEPAGIRASETATLLELEQRLRARRRGRAAGYAAALRDARFARAPAPAPGPGERRAVRRELAYHRGLAGRLRLLRAMPPGGPVGAQAQPG